MKDSDRERMMRYAKLPDEDQETISNLGYLGVQLTKKVIRDKQKQKQKKKTAKASDDVPDGMYELSRFVPRVKGILSHLVAGDLPDADFPSLDSGAAPSGGEEKKKAGKSAPKWADKSKSSPAAGAGNTSSSQEEDYVGASDSDPRYIVFVAGGMTYSEARSIYEVSISTSKNCYIGSTQFLTPDSFVFELNTLSKTADKAEAMEKEYIQKQEEAAKPKKKGEKGEEDPVEQATKAPA